MRLSLVVLYVPEPSLDRAARFYGAILDVEPVREQHGVGPEHWAVSSRLTGLVIEIYPADRRPATATRLAFRGPDVREAVARLTEIGVEVEKVGRHSWKATDPAGSVVVLGGSAGYDRLTAPIGLTLGNPTAGEATANRRRAAELIGRPLPVSEYEAGLYEAEGKTPPTE